MKEIIKLKPGEFYEINGQTYELTMDEGSLNPVNQKPLPVLTLRVL